MIPDRPATPGALAGESGGPARDGSHEPSRAAGQLPPVVVACPDDLIPLVARLVANDARPIFLVLWRTLLAQWQLADLKNSA